MAKKRGHGEGSVFKRKDGKWAGVITIGTSPTGKRLRKWIYGDKESEVIEGLRKLRGQRADGMLSDSGKMTVAVLIDRWLSDSAKPTVEPNTYIRYESVSRLHIKPAIGGIRLAKLSPMHVQAMLSSLSEKEVGARTVEYVFSTVRRALNVGLRWGLVTRNVCDACDPPKKVRPEVIPLTDGEVSELIRLAHGSRWYALFVLAITTGLRQGELFGLRWQDIDLQRGMISVRHSLEEIKGHHRLKTPKSASGRRSVTLPPPAVESLWAHLSIIVEEGLGGGEIVFPDTIGGFLRKSNFDRNVWQKFRDDAKIPETITFHDLRHTSATILFAAGVHPKVVQERLGHASIQLTMDTYSHILPSMQEEAATKFDHIRLKIAEAG